MVKSIRGVHEAEALTAAANVSTTGGTSRGTRWRLAILLALNVLSVVGLIFKTKPWWTGDSPRYLALALALEHGQGYGLQVGSKFEPEAWRMPGYPAFLWLCNSLTGHRYVGIIVVQAMLYLASVYLTWRVTTKLFDASTGLIFLALTAVYPFVAYNVGQVSPEIPSLFLVSLALYWLWRPEWSWWAAAGALLGLATYLRPNLLLLGVALALARIFVERRVRRQSVALVAGTVIVLLPWAVRNAGVFGVFTPAPVFKGMGTYLFLGSWEAKLSTAALVDYGMYQRVTPEMARSGILQQVRDINQTVHVAPNTLFVSPEFYPGNARKIQADRLFIKAARQNIKAWPTSYLKSAAVNSIRMWFSAFMTTGNMPNALNKLLLIQGVLMFMLGVIGMALTLGSAQGHARIFVAGAVGACLYFSVTLCWVHVEARYTIPVRLLLIAFAANALARLPKLVTAYKIRPRRSNVT